MADIGHLLGQLFGLNGQQGNGMQAGANPFQQIVGAFRGGTPNAVPQQQTNYLNADPATTLAALQQAQPAHRSAFQQIMSLFGRG